MFGYEWEASGTQGRVRTCILGAVSYVNNTVYGRSFRFYLLLLFVSRVSLELAGVGC